MASSRVSPSPKRCQAKAGGGRGKGCQPSGLCILLKLFVGVVVGKPVGVQPQLATRQSHPSGEDGPRGRAHEKRVSKRKMRALITSGTRFGLNYSGSH